MFQVSYSSSPPSTPDARRKTQLASHTPAGQPLFTFDHASTTPAGPPPPSSAFASRYDAAGASKDALQSQSAKGTNEFGNDLYNDEDIDMETDFVTGTVETRSAYDNLDASAMAKSLAGAPATLTESSDVVLVTDQILETVYSFDDMVDNGLTWSQAAAQAVSGLLQLWHGAQPTHPSNGIGPGSNAPPLVKCCFLASLVLQIHHPGKKQGKSVFRAPRAESSKPIPEVLLGWLEEHHNPFPDDFRELMAMENGPAASDRYWQVIGTLSIRGHIKDVCTLLREADFRFAYSALDDGADQPGYHDNELGNAQRAVNRAVSVLETCPAYQNGDWETTGPEWAVYRKRIQQAQIDLENFAESAFDANDDDFEAENFGVSTNGRGDFSVSRISRRAQSKVPWAIYEALKQLYAQILGSEAEIIAASADWVEATIGLAVWWDGSESGSKRDVTKQAAQKAQPREVDLRPVETYQRRFTASVRRVASESDEAELHVNPADPIQVGLACIFDGDVEGLLAILRGWSQTVSTAVAELARLGQWLQDPSKQLMDTFDEADLLVLSVSKDSRRGVAVDKLLLDYAHLVERRSLLRLQGTNEELEGWEVAVSILGRVQDELLANQEISQTLQRLEPTPKRLEKIIPLCIDFGLPDLGKDIAEGYADRVAQSNDFGEALFYYARAQKTHKVKQLLNWLNTTSLVHSCAFPIEKDPLLQQVLQPSSTAMTNLANLDPNSASTLQTLLAGYATLQGFYKLRDDFVNAPIPHRRKRDAATALVAVIQSAADSIYGGLYDKTIESVISVDGLLILLGEALPFVDETPRILTTPQTFALLRAVEDMSTVSHLIFAQAEQGFKAAIAARGTKAPMPNFKEASVLADSQFSIIVNPVSELPSNGSAEHSGFLVNGKAKEPLIIQRAWDWRTGLTETTSGRDLLQMLRYGLAKEVSRAWTESL